ncbi:hypothetical protein [Novipirellula sp.]|uniref:hypothetical protein n=1 Tax=Novipirellula sp. TaxID=2795430 RepID=UPI0035652C9F
MSQIEPSATVKELLDDESILSQDAASILLRLPRLTPYHPGAISMFKKILFAGVFVLAGVVMTSSADAAHGRYSRHSGHHHGSHHRGHHGVHHSYRAPVHHGHHHGSHYRAPYRSYYGGGYGYPSYGRYGSYGGYGYRGGSGISIGRGGFSLYLGR